ncbi:hypothetical protein DPSP01_004360 [Paraphaeosphaeria sporulosa]
MGIKRSTEDQDVEHMEDLESASLIPNKDCHKCSSAAKGSRTRHVFKTIVLIALAYICFLETNTRLAVQSRETHIHLASGIPYSNDVVQYAPRRIWQDGDWSRYDKKPGPELDALWNELLAGQIIRVSAAEMKLQGENLTNRVQLTNGDYLGTMSVWHSLHCLERLRKVIHMNYYHDKIPDYKGDMGIWTKDHSDHCMERLRDDIMCHPNTAVYIPEWDETHTLPDGFRMISQGQTTCVNWDALDQWARKRALKGGEYTLKPNPFGDKHGVHTNH